MQILDRYQQDDRIEHIKNKQKSNCQLPISPREAYIGSSMTVMPCKIQNG
jgi:hypothetical protein